MRTLLLLTVVSAVTLLQERFVSCLQSSDEVTLAKYPDEGVPAYTDDKEADSQDGDRVSALKKYLNLMEEKMSNAGILRFGRSLRGEVRPAAQPLLKLFKDEEDHENLRSVLFDARVLPELIAVGDPLEARRPSFLRLLMPKK